MGTIWTTLRKIPLTLFLLIVISLFGALTATVWRDEFPKIIERFGVNLPTIFSGEIWRIWISLFFANVPGIRITIVGILALGVGLFEYFYSTKLAAFTFFVLGPLATVLSLILLSFFAILKIPMINEALYVLDMGSSSASLFCWSIVLRNTRGLGRNLGLFLTFAILVGLFFFVDKPYTIDHLFAFLLGFGIVGALHPWRRRVRS